MDAVNRDAGEQDAVDHGAAGQVAGIGLASGLRGQRVWRVFRLTAVCLLTVCVLLFVLNSWRWPLVNDSAQISYACLLVDHGMAPYKELFEMNMPGIYLVNWSVMHTLGEGSAAWRIFDFSLLGVAAMAMLAIAWPHDWFGGFFGAALFALFHGRDGPAEEGQRDLIMAVLLLCSYALVFYSLRANRRWPMLLFGLCGAMAVAIKPVVLPIVLLVWLSAAWRMRALGWSTRAISPAMGLTAVGVMSILGGVWIFLAAHGSVEAFMWVIRDVLPYYARLGRESLPALAVRSVSPSILVLMAIAGAVAWARRGEWQWERMMLLGGVVLGFASFLMQGKGFPYHRYPMLAFALLWVGMEFAGGVRQLEWTRKLAIAGLAAGLILAPLYVAAASRRHWDEALNSSLQSDLNRLGGRQLSGGVQCLTTAADCHTVLYRMGLVQASGLMYDYLVFGPTDQAVTGRIQSRVWGTFQDNPPQVFIVTRGLYPVMAPNYDKLKMWPALDRDLAENYEMYAERSFAPTELGGRGYRIYVRRQR